MTFKILAEPSGGRWAYEYGLTNVEYTEFEKLGIDDKPADTGTHSAFPANTNILYVGLKAAREVLQDAVQTHSSGILPGLIFNTSKTLQYLNPHTGEERKVRVKQLQHVA